MTAPVPSEVEVTTPDDREASDHVRDLVTFFRMIDSGGPDGTELDTLVYDEARVAADALDPPTDGEW